MGESKSKKANVKAPGPVSSKTPETNTLKNKVQHAMTYGKAQFKWMLIGVGFIVLGLLLMLGGSMPSPEVWDESLIYSPIRLTLAPMLIIIGLGFQVYAIFKVED